MIQYDKLYENEKFSLHFATGNEYTPAETFIPRAQDGTVLPDAIALSNKPMTIVRFDRLVTAYAAYTDISIGQTKSGSVVMLWDEDFKYWCVSDTYRPRMRHSFTSRIYRVPAGSPQVIPLIAGDSLITIEPTFSVIEIEENQTQSIEADEDQVVIAVRPTKL